MTTTPRRFGRFELIESASSGGMAEVYRARVVGGTRPFALKKLPKDAADNAVLANMFVDEARMAQSVAGPNLARLIDHGDAEGEHYLLFEWIDGVTLEATLRALEYRGERLSVDQVARLFARISDCLTRVHATVDAGGLPTNMVHRDVSPGNILIDADGEVSLIDFGLSRSTVQRHRTEPGLVKGKFGYLAPEQLDGACDARTDLFALGVCFYESLTGARLFERPSIDATITALREFEGIQSVRGLRPDVSEALDDVIRKLLSPNPDDRFANAEEAKRAIYGAKPALVLSGEDLDEANGIVVSRLFPELRTTDPAREAARTTSRHLKRTHAPTTEDVGRRIAGMVMLFVVLILAALMVSAMLSH